MSPELFGHIADGKKDFLHDHNHFEEDISKAVCLLEKMLNI